MTSIAFILGIIPLVVATGNGAASRNSLGTVVFGGMASTFGAVVGAVVVLFVWHRLVLSRVIPDPGSRRWL